MGGREVAVYAGCGGWGKRRTLGQKWVWSSGQRFKLAKKIWCCISCWLPPYSQSDFLWVALSIVSTSLPPQLNPLHSGLCPCHFPEMSRAKGTQGPLWLAKSRPLTLAWLDLHPVTLWAIPAFNGSLAPCLSGPSVVPKSLGQSRNDNITQASDLSLPGFPLCLLEKQEASPLSSRQCIAFLLHFRYPLLQGAFPDPSGVRGPLLLCFSWSLLWVWWHLEPYVFTGLLSLTVLEGQGYDKVPCDLGQRLLSPVQVKATLHNEGTSPWLWVF